MESVKEEVTRGSYGEYTQFKLNIRIPNLHSIRNVLLLRHYQHCLCIFNPDWMQVMYNMMILPFETNKSVEFKTVLKWLIAH